MPLPSMNAGLSLAATDLGLGNMLSEQRDNQTDEEKRRRHLGLSVLGGGLNYGQTGIASMDLGMSGAGGR
jgi:hypothetical protein